MSGQGVCKIPVFGMGLRRRLGLQRQRRGRNGRRYAVVQERHVNQLFAKKKHVITYKLDFVNCQVQGVL